MITPECRCPFCRRFPRTMKTIAELEGKPMSQESRLILDEIVKEAYIKLADRIVVNGKGER